MTSTSPTRVHQWRPMWVALVALVGAAVLALVFDQWYRGFLISRERERVLAYSTPYASALESAVGRRLSRLSGLRSFVETRRTLKELNDEFRPFATGLRVGMRGIRAFELVRDGRITNVVPEDSNRTVMGYDLYRDARPFIPGDVRRAMETGLVTITGPTALLQGGDGLIARQRIARSDSSYPDLVAMVLDLPAILNEAADFSRPSALTLVVLDRKRRVLSGPVTPLEDPVSVTVRIPDGGWTLLASPPNGWSASVAGDLRPTRIASAMIALLVAWVVSLVAGTQQRLRRAVEEQTQYLRTTNDALVSQVHEREAAENRLREQDEQLRLALTSGRMGTWTYDVATDALELSSGALEMLGTPDAAADRAGSAFRDALPPEAREVFTSAFNQALVTGAFRTEFRFVPLQGDDRWLYCTGEVQPDPTGARRLAGVVMDVTERRQLEEQLLHSQKMEAVGTLAGGIAHDFNNLLTAILGFARLSQQQADALGAALATESARHGFGELRGDLEEIVKAGERATLLTSQLLAFSRRQVTKPIRLDVCATVRDVERMLKRLIGERVALETYYSPQPTYVRADAGQLAQVVVNLVVNARDAMPNGGTIRVNTDSIFVDESGSAVCKGLPAGRWALLTVQDDGVGMSPEVISRMFEPFFTTKRVGEGTGLGLSTVYGIVTEAGGQTFVESAPGAGTTVRIALPWDDAADRRLRTPLMNDAITPIGKRVLVVEDEPGLRRLIGQILSRRGFSVDIARDGQEALAMFDTDYDPPDLVLTDVVMPRLGGPALANELARRGISIPVIFMSGYPADSELKLAEGQIFIDKPFTPDALVTKVREVLSPD